MFSRVVCKLHKTVLIVVLYYIVYSLFSYAFTPEPPVVFVSEEYQISDKYGLIFLVAHPKPVFTDADGADVLTTRRCGKCFITNNKGFLPMTEYDAVLVYGKRNLLSEAEAATEPGKRYLIETTNKCIENKLRGCMWEPDITSFGTKQSYTLCSLCDHLLQQKKSKAVKFY